MSDTSVDLSAQIAGEIMSQGILVSWPQFAVLLALSFLGGAAGSFLWAYFSKRGEALATKADFDRIIEQTRKSTKAAEEAKAEVESVFGETASRRALLREKLEELFVQVSALSSWHENLWKAAFHGEVSNVSSPFPMIEMLKALYFREVGTEVSELCLASNDLIIWCGEYVKAHGQARAQRAQPPAPDMARFRVLIDRINAAQRCLHERVFEAYGPRAGL